MSKNLTIGDVLDTVSVTHKFNKNELIFLNTSDVLEGKILTHAYMPVSEMKGQAKKTIQNGDILFSEIRPKNKRYAYVDVTNSEDYVVSTKLMVLRNKTKDVLTKYIYYFLTYEETLNYLQMRAENRICSFPQITFDVLKPLAIKVPSLLEQQKIIDIISALDAKIELNNRINAELESLAKTIYDYWFVQFDFPNADGKPYKSSGGEMVYVEEGKGDRAIPAGWEIRKLEDFTLIHDSKRIPLSKKQRESIQGEIPYYGATSVMDYVNDYIFDGIYILLAEDGSVMDSQGNPVLQYIWGKTWVNNHAHVLEGTNGFSNEFLHLLLKNVSVVQIMSGSIQKKINQNNLMRTPVLVPDIKLLEEFQKLIKPIYEKKILIFTQNQQLTQLRDWLLPMLMNGQVSIK